MRTQSAIYLALLLLCIVIAGITLALYYSQNFEEDYSFKNQLRLADVVFEAYDQNNYDTNYNCRYNEFNVYVCDQQNTSTLRVLQSATANIGKLDLDNQGYFTQVYQAPRLLGCIEFANYEASNGLRFPREFSIEYRKTGSSGDVEKDYYNYGYYGYEGPRLEIKSGKESSYDLIAHYQPYSIPLADFTKANIKQIVVYEIPTKHENPLSDDYGYSSFYYNPTCDSAEDQSIEPKAVISIA